VTSYRYAAGTRVEVNRSRDELESLLDRIGADSVATMRDSAAAAVAFRLTGRNYVLRLPFLTEEEIRKRRRVTKGQMASAMAQSSRERWRALLLLVKAKIVAIDTGVTTPEAEFLAHAMLPTGQTLGEHLSEHPEQLTTSGRLMLPGGESA
jgi:hypothetical protein